MEELMNKHGVSNSMQKYDGPFVRYLAHRVVTADRDILIRLKNAFPEIFLKYEKLAEDMKKDPNL